MYPNGYLFLFCFVLFIPLKATLGSIASSMVETYEQLSSTVDQNEIYRVGANILDTITNIYKVFAKCVVLSKDHIHCSI